MGRSKTSGVYRSEDGTFEVDARYKRQRIRKRGCASQAEAAEYLISQREALRQAADPMARKPVTLEKAAAHLLTTKEGMPSAVTDSYMLTSVVKWNGSLTIDKISDQLLEEFVAERRAAGWKNKTINNALECVRTIVNRASKIWRFENGMTWIAAAPKITLLPLTDQRPPRPITWEEQARLLPLLPPYLAAMAEFDLNTGVRRAVICNLRWDWEVRVTLRPGLEASVFVVPRRFVKGRKAEKLIVCNSVAQAIIEKQRGLHDEYVFVYSRQTKTDRPKTYHRLATMYSPAWRKAREDAKLDDLHVHDLRHTVGMRLRSAGVSERTQNEILWHTEGSMASHYAVAQLREIHEALELISKPGEEGESLNLLALMRKMRMRDLPQKSPRQKKAA